MTTSPVWLVELEAGHAKANWVVVECGAIRNSVFLLSAQILRFELQPRWYLFLYLSGRLGLRLREVYATSRSRLREIPPQLIVGRALQRGTKTRPAEIIDRKNEEAYALELPQDAVQAIRWHVQQGYSGEDCLFAKTGNFPR